EPRTRRGSSYAARLCRDAQDRREGAGHLSKGKTDNNPGGSLFRRHWHKHLCTAAFDQQWHRLGRILDDLAQLLSRLHGYAVDADDDVAGLNTCFGGWAGNAFDEDRAIGVELFLFLLRERSHCEPELCFLTLCLRHRRCALLRGVLHLLDGYLKLALFSLAPDAEHRLCARLELGHGDGELVRSFDRLIVDLQNHITCFQARFGCRALRLDRAHQRTAWLVEPEYFGQLGVHILDGHADAPTHHASCFDELFAHIHGHIDWDGGREPHVATRAAEDHRIDTDDLAIHVEQRAT